MITSSDITFVIQGNLRAEIQSCIASVRKNFKKSKILLSTWEGEDTSSVEVDDVVFSVDPHDSGNVVSPTDPKQRSHPNNLNRQIVSSYNGLKKVTTPYAVKFRSDLIIKSSDILRYYNKLESLKLDFDEKWRMFRHRIMMLYACNPHHTNLSYHIVDYLQLGHTEDLIEFWNIPLITMDEAQYCVLNNRVHPVRQRAYRYSCEQEIWLRNLEKFNIPFKKPDIYFDSDSEMIEQTERSFVNNLYFIDYAAADISSKFDWLKKKSHKWPYKFDDYYKWYTSYIGKSADLKKYFQFYMEKIEKAYKCKDTRTKIKSREISVVVQGAIDTEKTKRCIKSIRKHLPYAELIISSWRGSDVSALDYDNIILSDDPGNFLLTKNGIYNNVNRQILSTKKGLKIASRPYCLKIRSDAYIKNGNFLNLLSGYFEYEPDYHLLKHRLLIPSYFTRDPNRYERGLYKNTHKNYSHVFHPSDMIMFGKTDDMLSYWDIPLQSVDDTKEIYKGIYGKYIPEQYIFLAFLHKKGHDADITYYGDSSVENKELTERYFASNFIIANYNEFGIGWQSDRFSIRKNPSKFLSCYTPHVWEQLYIKHCKHEHKLKRRYDWDILYINLCMSAQKIFGRNKTEVKIMSKKITNTLIMPTYHSHFKYVKIFLKSARKYLLDFDTTEIVFIISNNELNSFNRIIAPYTKHLRIKVLEFESILRHFNVSVSPEAILKKYGRFTYQTLKKLYSMLYLNRKRYLVIDSESMFIRPTNLNSLSNQFFQDPYILTSKINESERNGVFMLLNENIHKLIGVKSNEWPLEHYAWFYDINILKDLVKACGMPFEMAQHICEINKKANYITDLKNGIFEIVLYLNFIIKNNKKYNYKIKSVDSLLKKHLTDSQLTLYREQFYNQFHGNCGLLEHAMLFLNENNWRNLAELFFNNKINIFRCDRSTAPLYKWQKKFLSITSPYLLTSSQNHCFGLNASLFSRCIKFITNSKYRAKFSSHLSKFLRPFKYITRPIGAIFTWIWHLISTILCVISAFLFILKYIRVIIKG